MANCSGFKKKNTMKKFPIVIAFDENYLLPACVMLTSMFENAGAETEYKVFIFADSETRQKSLQRINETLSPYPRRSQEVPMRWRRKMAYSKTRRLRYSF